MKFSIKRFVPALFLIALTFMMILPAFATMFPNITFVASASSTQSASTIIVPDNYPSIAAAIGNASAGDKIIVRSGTYFENPIINKPLTLQADAGVVVVGAGGFVGASVFTVMADGVEISGFIITSLNYSTSANYAYGILVEGDKCTVTGNTIVNALSGIFCSVQSSNLISQNTITGNHKDGIRFYGGTNNSICENNIVNNTASGIAIQGYYDNISENNLSQDVMGIGLGATYSVIFRNNITQNSNSGIYLPGSDNIISANYIANNKYGIYSTPSFGTSCNNTIIHNDFVGNDKNAYLTSPDNIQIWDQGYPAGGNYWSDYSTVCPNATEIANSGIMNLAYTVCDNNTDKNPLMAAFDTSNAVAPLNEKTAPATGSNHVAALWSFDSVEPNYIAEEPTGANSAVLGTEAANVSYTPVLSQGKFGKALFFNGNAYAYVPPSPNLTIKSDITIDAWINISQYKNVTYNNIVIEAQSTTAKYPTRILGLAVNGVAAQNSSSPVLGALRGYVTTDTAGFNEISTTQPIPLNQWVHVVFTRSLQTGMHLYVNGVMQNVTVTAGTQNPTGSIEQASSIFLGHDAIVTLDNVRILNVAAESTSTVVWQQWWFWTPIAAALVALAGALYYYNVKKNAKTRTN